MTFVLGLTGSIATGKSTVSKVFKEVGIPIVDADVGARAVVKKGTEGLKRIEATFGPSVILSDGTLDRKALGKIVFRNQEELEKLNRILANLISVWICKEKDRYVRQGVPLIIMDIPLLFESGYDKKVDKVMVVVTTPEIQLERLMQRDGVNKETAYHKINAQWPITEKLLKADYVIDNNGSKENTRNQVLSWLKRHGFEGSK